MSTDSADSPLRFGRFEIRPAERVLCIGGENAAVGARAFDLLLALVERRGHLVSKQELLDRVWPGVVVEENNIATQISTLRKLLGPDVIATIPGRGYRFVAAPPQTQPTSVPTAPATHLPRQLTPIIGRDQELSALAGLLTRHRLVTVIGAGGMGKTLLAQHALAALQAQGARSVCWVDLTETASAAELPQRIADALGLRLMHGEPLASLAAGAASLQVVVALDNAEHLLADVARTVATLLDAAPALALLVTSQAPLRLAAEQLFRVGPLALPQGPLPAAMAQAFAAVALFVERARATDPGFVLADADAPILIEMCQALDGMPLAIELAAARAPLLGLRSLAASMHDRLALLTRNRDVAAPARQQTLRAALEWSHEQLAERERIVFRRLGVMAGSTTLAFMQRVVADEARSLDAWAVVDALGELVDRSLVAVLPEQDDSETCYRLLESPRALALEQLRTAGEEAALRRRHATALASAFDEAWVERWNGLIGVQPWAQRLMRDAAQAREAIAWARDAAEPGLAVALAATLSFALRATAHLESMALADLCESLADEPGLSPALRLRALDAAIRPMTHRQQQRSHELATQALALARQLERESPDRWRLCKALGAWIDSASLVADPPRDALHAALAELDTLEDASWPPQRTSVLLNTRRWAHSTLHPHDEQAEQLALTRRWIDAVAASQGYTERCIGSLIDAELNCGHVHEAVHLGEEALARLADTRDEWSRMMTAGNLALALLARDDVARARALMQQVWPAALRFQVPQLFADDMALLAALEGRPQAAARLAGYADAGYDARSQIRHPNEIAQRARTEAVVRRSLDGAQFESLLVLGRSLRGEQVGSLTFDSADFTR